MPLHGIRPGYHGYAAAAMCGVFMSCSQGAPRSAPTEPAALPAVVDEVSEVTAAYLAGRWKWSHASEDRGVRRVEVETWQLAPAPASAAAEPGAVALHGRYTRTIDFLAMDGKPFACSQDLGYQLRASYTVAVVVRGEALEIAETGYRTEPSPCERGERNLTRYRGALIDDGARLRLDWDGGEQTLVRVHAPESGPAIAGVITAPAEAVPPSRVSAAAAAADTEEQPESIAGAWRWHGRTSAGGEVRVELEDWLLEEGPNGAIRGSVTRTVTVFDERGTYYPCSGDTFYRYQDRYTVRGERRAGVVQLTEVGVQSDDHPCLPYRERHLDGARGARSGAYLELTWRGNRRQVLHRPR